MTISTNFWSKYFVANEIEQQKMLRSLQLCNPKTAQAFNYGSDPEEMYRHSQSTLLHSYIDDLIEYIRENGVPQ